MHTNICYMHASISIYCMVGTVWCLHLVTSFGVSQDLMSDQMICRSSRCPRFCRNSICIYVDSSSMGCRAFIRHFVICNGLWEHVCVLLQLEVLLNFSYGDQNYLFEVIFRLLIEMQTFSLRLLAKHLNLSWDELLKTIILYFNSLVVVSASAFAPHHHRTYYVYLFASQLHVYQDRHFDNSCLPVAFPLIPFELWKSQVAKISGCCSFLCFYNAVLVIWHDWCMSIGKQWWTRWRWWQWRWWWGRKLKFLLLLWFSCREEARMKLDIGKGNS